MNLQVSRSVNTRRLAASLAAAVLLGAALLPGAVLAANDGATKLVIAASSLGAGNATAGVSFTLTVQAQDNANVVRTGFTDAVTISSSDSQAALGPNPYTYASGDAGSHVFTITLKTVGSRTVTFSSSGLVSATATITVDPSPASTLVFTQQPSTSPSGVAFLTQPRVAVQDAFGNTIVADSTTKVTLTLVAPTAGGPGTLSGCTAAATVSAGVAAFGGCVVTGVGVGYKLTATDTTGGGGGHPYTAATSAAFDVPDNLVFAATVGGGAGASSTAQGGIAFTNQPRVNVRAVAALSANDATTSVTLAIRSGTGTAGAILTCDQAANTLKVVAGSAPFTGCRIDKAGTGYQLVATSVPAYGVNAWYSNTFNVVAGPATKLTFVTQPGGASAGQVFTTQPVVAITDAGGNIVTSGVRANVSLTIGTNPGVPAGALSCSAITVATATSGGTAGQAAFSGCKISNSGVGYTLIATPSSIVGVSSLASATSSAFTVAAPAAQITLTRSQSTITWGQTLVLTTQFLVNGAGKTFTLQAARDGVTWTTIATLTTDSSGKSAYPYRPATNNYYRAVFAGTPDLQAATSAAGRTVVRQISFLRPTNGGATKSIARNTSVTFTATVRPSRPELTRPTVTFFFYRLSGSTWVLSTKRNVTADLAGQARTTFKFTSAGRWYVRSQANPTPYNANSVMTPPENYSVR
jgi:hypothetical protein